MANRDRTFTIGGRSVGRLSRMVDEIKTYMRRHPGARVTLAGASEESLKEMQGRLEEYADRVTLWAPKVEVPDPEGARILTERILKDARETAFGPWVSIPGPFKTVAMYPGGAPERKYPDDARVKVIKLNPFDDGLFDYALNQPGTVLSYRQHPMMLKPHMVYEVKLDCHPVPMLYTEDYLGPANEEAPQP